MNADEWTTATQRSDFTLIADLSALHRVLRTCCLRACIAGLCLSSGCTLVGAMASKMSGSKEVPASYVPAQKPMLVLVEKSDNPGALPIDSERIARMIANALDLHKVVPLTDASALAELRSRNPGKYDGLSPAEAGRVVGAKQVLYVDVIDFRVEDAIATDMTGGRVEVRVRVIDSNSGQTLWPLDTTQGFPMTVDTQYGQSGEKQTAAALREKMCRDLSDKISRLFFKYHEDEVPDEANQIGRG